MRAASLVVRSVRNLTDAELVLPARGIALLGPNGHGKTNLLEALAYPVLFRSLRGARDREVARFGGPGFHVGLVREDGLAIAVTWDAAGGRKRVTIDGADCPRITDALGHWLAVAFLPTDLALVQGGAAERRRWLDRMLSLAHPAYLGALLRYRAAVAQRNAAIGSMPSSFTQYSSSRQVACAGGWPNRPRPLPNTRCTPACCNCVSLRRRVSTVAMEGAG